MSSMLKRSREVERETTSVIGRTSDTGRPLACRSCSWMARAQGERRHARPHDPRHRSNTHIQRVHGIGHLRLGDEHLRKRIVVQPAIARIGHDADDLPLGLVRELAHHASADDEPVVQRIAFLPELLRHRFIDDDDGGVPATSRSVNVRPRLTGILKTSKYPGETVAQPPPPWKGSFP